MATLTQFRSWLALDLNDPYDGTTRFTASALDRAITRAVADLTLAAPYEIDVEMQFPVNNPTRWLSLSAPGFSTLLEILEVEQPYGANGANATYPPTLVPFQLAVDRSTVRVLGRNAPASGEWVRLRGSYRWSTTENTTNLPVEWDAAISKGAAAYALAAYATPQADNFKWEDGTVVGLVDTTAAPRAWASRYRTLKAEWDAWLEGLRQARAHRGRAWATWEPAMAKPDWPTTNEQGLRYP